MGISMRSYIKIYGPPVYEAIRALEKIAFKMPEVSIMDTIIEFGFLEPDYDEDALYSYFDIAGLDMSRTRSTKIISARALIFGFFKFTRAEVIFGSRL
jgi:hypothetical protein